MPYLPTLTPGTTPIDRHIYIWQSHGVSGTAPESPPRPGDGERGGEKEPALFRSRLFAGVSFCVTPVALNERKIISCQFIACPWPPASFASFFVATCFFVASPNCLHQSKSSTSGGPGGPSFQVGELLSFPQARNGTDCGNDSRWSVDHSYG